MASIAIPPGGTDAWLALLTRDQQFRLDMLHTNGQLSNAAIAETIPEAVAAANENRNSDTGNTYVDEMVSGLSNDQKADLASWHAADMPTRSFTTLCRFRAQKRCLIGNVLECGTQYGIGRHDMLNNLSIAWVLVGPEDSVVNHLNDPRVLEVADRLRALESN
jgi:hypothetical protein